MCKLTVWRASAMLRPSVRTCMLVSIMPVSFKTIAREHKVGGTFPMTPLIYVMYVCRTHHHLSALSVEGAQVDDNRPAMHGRVCPRPGGQQLLRSVLSTPRPKCNAVYGKFVIMRLRVPSGPHGTFKLMCR